MNVRAALVDFVLTLFEPVSNAELALFACESSGLSVTAAEAATIGERADRAWHSSRVIDHETSTSGYRAAFIQAMTEAGDRVAELAAALHDAEADPRCWRPYADASALLEMLNGSGAAVGIVSNFGHDIRPIFAYHGLARHVAVYAVSSQVGAAKPDPEIFRYALQHLGVAAQDALMIGDDPINDGGANAVGVRTLILAQPRNRASRLHSVLSAIRKWEAGPL